jgi:teichuronic acid exporter
MDLRARVMSALRWTAAARLAGQVGSWLITIIVIRVLDPQDYGLQAMATAFTATLVLLSAGGLSTVLVQNRTLDLAMRRQIFGVVVLINLGFFALILFGAPVIAAFYGEPRIVPVLQVLSIQFLFLIFETMPQSQIERDINFKRMSIVDLTTAIAGALTTLALALAGAGIWALVAGVLVTTGTRIAGLNFIAPFPHLPKFSFRGMAAHFRFGGFVCGERALSSAFIESEKLIGGRLLGSQAFGFYTVASHIASLPIQKVTGFVNSIAFSAFSEAHARQSHAGEYLLRAIRFMSLLVFPIFIGIAAVSEDFVGLVLGPKWLAVAPLLTILAVVMPIRMMSNLLTPALWGVGKPHVSAGNFAIQAFTMAPAFFAGAWFGGTRGLALAWITLYPLVFLVVLHRSCPHLGISAGAVLRQIAWPLAISLAMLAAVLGSRGLVAGAPGSAVHLAQLVAIGLAVYLAGIWAVDRARVRELKELVA